jgi:hypothetical protein
MLNRLIIPVVILSLAAVLTICSAVGAGTISSSATLTSIEVTPANPSISLGKTQQFTATGTYSDNTKQNLTKSVTWDSSSRSVAVVSNASGSNGLATAITPGPTTITATSGNISGFTVLSVDCTAPAGSTITIMPSSLTISIAADTNLNWKVVVKTPDGNPMPRACLHVSGSFAFHSNPTHPGVHYQFYYYPDGTNNKNSNFLGNIPVNSPFIAETDDSGQYTFSAFVSVARQTFTGTIVVLSGLNVGTATVTVEKKHD